MTLRRDLGKPVSPLRIWLDRHIDRDAIPGLKDRLGCAGAGPLLPSPPEGVRADTVGHAVGRLAAWSCDAKPAATFAGPDSMASLALSLGQIHRGAELAELVDLSTEEPGEVLVRKAWLGALVEQSYRSGDPSLVDVFRESNPLSSVAPEIVAHLQRFLPYLPSTTHPAVSEASPSHSQLVGDAQADIVTGGRMIEVKTSKEFRPRLRDVHQLACLILLDGDDTLGIREVSIFWARWPYEASIEADEFIRTLFGGHCREELSSDLIQWLEARRYHRAGI